MASCLCIPRAGITSFCHHRVLGTELRSSCLHGKLFNLLSHIPSSNIPLCLQGYLLMADQLQDNEARHCSSMKCPGPALKIVTFSNMISQKPLQTSCRSQSHAWAVVVVTWTQSRQRQKDYGSEKLRVQSKCEATRKLHGEMRLSKAREQGKELNNKVLAWMALRSHAKTHQMTHFNVPRCI